MLETLIFETPGGAYELMRVRPWACMHDLLRTLTADGWRTDIPPGADTAGYLLREGVARRLGQQETVESARLRSGDRLRSILVPAPGCLVQLYRQDGELLHDTLRAGLPAASIPLQAPREAMVRQVIDELDRRSARPELFVMAWLKWPDDAELRQALRTLATQAEHPAEIAPVAWSNLSDEEQEQLRKAWPALRHAGPSPGMPHPQEAAG